MANLPISSYPFEQGFLSKIDECTQSMRILSQKWHDFQEHLGQQIKLNQRDESVTQYLNAFGRISFIQIGMPPSQLFNNLTPDANTSRFTEKSERGHTILKWNPKICTSWSGRSAISIDTGGGGFFVVYNIYHQNSFISFKAHIKWEENHLNKWNNVESENEKRWGCWENR